MASDADHGVVSMQYDRWPAVRPGVVRFRDHVWSAVFSETVLPMVEHGSFERRLTAVAFADAVGYSTEIGRDDVQAVLAWKSLRADIVEPRIAGHNGRLLRVIGDGLLVAFQSAVDAVSWAISVQDAIAARSDADRGFRIRIGIDVEDVLVDGDDVHGDGVNIAARIQQLAEPGEAVVTERVRDYIGTKLDVRFVDLGEQRLKNIRQQVRVYRLEGNGGTRVRIAPATSPDAGNADGSASRGIHVRLAWSQRPAIAVLPFRNMGGNPGEDYFGEGITEDIIAALSRTRSLVVTARNSTLRYRERLVEPRQIASELGVRYLLDGSVRRASGRLRISSELIDANQSRTLWADRYDGANDELFDFQDRIASSIVARIPSQVLDAEADRAGAKPTQSLDAYDCMLRAYPLLNSFDNQAWEEAVSYIDRALLLDPQYARAHSYRAWLHVLFVAEARSRDVATDKRLARQHVERARQLDPKDPHVLAVAGHVQALLLNDPVNAAGYFADSLALDDCSAFAWGFSGLTYCYLGEPDEALARFARAERLSPFDPFNFFFLAGAGLAHFLAGRYEASLPWMHKALRINPRFLACLRHQVAALAQLGRIEEARKVGAQILAIEPDFRVSTVESWYPLRPRENLHRYVEGLRVAGLPE
jgi:TolB-like protein/class 3 adenylate cyclase/Flp pilus assembly protein TadD